jgi:hypothetical protein
VKINSATPEAVEGGRKSTTQKTNNMPVHISGSPSGTQHCGADHSERRPKHSGINTVYGIHPNRATTAPVANTPDIADNPDAREFLRLPKSRQRCPHTGLTRSFLNALILPCPANNFHPPVKSYCLRQRGAKTGCRIISYQSLRNYIFAHEDVQAAIHENVPQQNGRAS